MIDAKDVSAAHRARYFWGNLPGMNRLVGGGGGHSGLWTTAARPPPPRVLCSLVRCPWEPTDGGVITALCQSVRSEFDPGLGGITEHYSGSRCAVRLVVD